MAGQDLQVREYERRGALVIIDVFRVKKPDEFNRPRIDPDDREIVRKKSFVSKKVGFIHIIIKLYSKVYLYL